MNSGRRASRKTPPKKTPPAADRTVAETIDRRLNELRPAERRAAGTLLADYPSAGLGTVADLAQRAQVSPPSGDAVRPGSRIRRIHRRPKRAAGGADAAVEGAAGAGRVTRVAVQRFQRCGRAFSVGCPIEQLRNFGAEVLLSAQHARHLEQPMETHALPFRGLLVDLAAFQAPAGYSSTASNFPTRLGSASSSTPETSSSVPSGS